MSAKVSAMIDITFCGLLRLSFILAKTTLGGDGSMRKQGCETEFHSQARSFLKCDLLGLSIIEFPESRRSDFVGFVRVSVEKVRHFPRLATIYLRTGSIVERSAEERTMECPNRPVGRA